MARDVIKKSTLPSSATLNPDSRYLTSRGKRIADIVASIFGILITAVMYPFVAILIKLDSSGPVLYRQVRLGANGREFSLVKFRTMIQDAEAGGEAVWASENDPRITRVGRIIRGLYIDEFPQWWNVAKGDMSVVGPRPERPELVELITEKYPRFVKRLDAKPGITGLAQTEYRYANSVTDSRHKLAYDRKYISEASLALDFWIVLRTFRRVVTRRGT
jgi:lipopolysaccharide/colanic/teichoic acid biosynthesis glycosyltransferase